MLCPHRARRCSSHFICQFWFVTGIPFVLTESPGENWDIIFPHTLGFIWRQPLDVDRVCNYMIEVCNHIFPARVFMGLELWGAHKCIAAIAGSSPWILFSALRTALISPGRTDLDSVCRDVNCLWSGRSSGAKLHMSPPQGRSTPLLLLLPQLMLTPSWAPFFCPENRVLPKRLYYILSAPCQASLRQVRPGKYLYFNWIVKQDLCWYKCNTCWFQTWWLFKNEISIFLYEKKKKEKKGRQSEVERRKVHNLWLYTTPFISIFYHGDMTESFNN